MTPVATPPREAVEALRTEVWAGLGSRPRRLPTRLLYDTEGARLFQEITRLGEYYLTRTETGILERCLGDLARRVGPGARVVEPGSGSGEKARMLLGALQEPSAYIPVDVASEQLRAVAEGIRAEHSRLEVRPLVADYTHRIRLPRSRDPAARTVAFFPGSTIGNFEPEDARDFLEHLALETGPGGALILGTDLVKPSSVLLPAYDDSEGVTAAFNLNVLRHLNRVLGTDFDLRAFRHEAIWNPEASRIEMRLVSLRTQEVTIPGSHALDPGSEEPEGGGSTRRKVGSRPERRDGGSHPVRRAGESDPSGGGAGDRVTLAADDRIVTEHSYKYAPDALEAFTEGAGWTTRAEWKDDRGWFSVRFLERRADLPPAPAPGGPRRSPPPPRDQSPRT